MIGHVSVRWTGEMARPDEEEREDREEKVQDGCLLPQRSAT